MKVRTLVSVAAVIAMLLGSAAIADEQGVAWDSLSAEQQQVLNRFADSWDSLPADRQMRLSRGAVGRHDAGAAPAGAAEVHDVERAAG